MRWAARIFPISVFCFGLALSSCSTSKTSDRYYPESWMPPALGGIQRPPTRTENWKNYKVGKPYQIEGKWYYPKEQINYKEVGTASWYGAQFHNKYTANGEIFDRRAYTAAHRTLPMPCIARVTNLRNGRSTLVRINDRGPFEKGRVIDVSEATAQELGFRDQGTARVKVEFDKKATAALFYDGYDPDEASKPVQRVARHDTSHKETTLTTRLHPGRYDTNYVQTGAYSSRDNAHEIAKTLQKVGQVLIEETEYKGNILYRVKVGPYRSEAEAGEALDEVAYLGFNDAIIVGN